MAKLTIEDLAFEQWDGNEDAYIFADKFLTKYPGFEEFFLVSELAQVLEERK